MKKTSHSLPCWLQVLVTCIMLVFTGCQKTGDPQAAAVDQQNAARFPDPFLVGFFAGDDTVETFDNSNPLVKHLKATLGVDVQIKTSQSYTSVIEAMRAKRIHAMQVGSFSYCFAVVEAGAEALAASVQAETFDPELQPFYFSVIFTRKGNGIETLEDVRGHSFSFVDPASTSGNLMPRTLLMKSGIDPQKDIRSRFAGSHPASVLAVANGTMDVGVTYETALQRHIHDSTEGRQSLYPDGKIHVLRPGEFLRQRFESARDGDLVVIAQSAPIPNTPFAIRGDLDKNFKDAVKSALLSYKFIPDEAASAQGVLAKWYSDPSQVFGFTRVDQFYDPLREAAQMLKLDLKSIEK